MLDIIWTILFLTVCSFTDIKEQKINILFCLINIPIMVLLHVISGDFSIWNIVGGMMFGAILYIISKVSKDGIGMGDVFMLGTFACVCGIMKTVEVLFWSSAICVLFSVIRIAMGKANLKSKIPFAPFVLIGNIIFWTCNCISGSI